MIPLPTAVLIAMLTGLAGLFVGIMITAVGNKRRRPWVELLLIVIGVFVGVYGLVHVQQDWHYWSVFVLGAIILCIGGYSLMFW